jgi:hypothetical protein
MGQLRQTHCSVGAKPGITIRGAMLPTLLIGFALSAIAVFAAAYYFGGVARGIIGGAILVLLIPTLVYTTVSDLTFPRFTSTLMRRQTPVSLSGRFPKPLAGFLWGADTGLVVTTFRASGASWAALALTASGWGPWWTGAAYAGGFCIPLGLLIGTYSVKPIGDRPPLGRLRSTEEVALFLGTHVRFVRIAAAVGAAVSTAAALSTI